MQRVGGSQFFTSEPKGEAKYEVSHVIGKGSYGTVCAARNKHTGEKVAIKHIDRVFADKADTVRIIRELRFLRILKHPNIIGVVDVLMPQVSGTEISAVVPKLSVEHARLLAHSTLFAPLCHQLPFWTLSR